MGMGLPLTKTMKILIGLNVVTWLVGQIVLEMYAGLPFSKYLALYPGKVIFDGAIWQLVTYMFLHSSQVTHLVLNMLMLWFMGAELEQKWGSKYFTIYYFCSGVGASVIYTLVIWGFALISGSTQGLVIPVVGASGAIFGLMLAYGILFGERVVHFMMIFPMKAKYFVMILGAIEIVSMLTNGIAGGEVANLAHLGGIASGYITLVVTAYRKQAQSQKSKKRSSGLRLVVDNEKKQSSSDKDPRYWN